MAYNIEQVKDIVPKGTSSETSSHLLDLINNMGNDTGLMQEYMEEMFERNRNLLDGRSKIQITRYIQALEYVTLKQRFSNKDAWIKVFRSRYEKLIKDGRTDKEISANISMYNRSSLVVEIEKQMLVDFSIYYNWARHEALMKNVDLMRGKAAPSLIPKMKINKKTKKEVPVLNSKGEQEYKTVHMIVTPMIQQKAADSILDITKPPEDKNITLKIGITDEAIKQQKDTEQSMRSLAQAMRDAMVHGADIEDVQVIGHVISGENNDTE